MDRINIGTKHGFRWSDNLGRIAHINRFVHGGKDHISLTIVVHHVLALHVIVRRRLDNIGSGTAEFIEVGFPVYIITTEKVVDKYHVDINGSHVVTKNHKTKILNAQDDAVFVKGLLTEAISDPIRVIGTQRTQISAVYGGLGARGSVLGDSSEIFGGNLFVESRACAELFQEVIIFITCAVERKVSTGIKCSTREFLEVGGGNSTHDGGVVRISLKLGR